MNEPVRRPRIDAVVNGGPGKADVPVRLDLVEFLCGRKVKGIAQFAVAVRYRAVTKSSQAPREFG